MIRLLARRARRPQRRGGRGREGVVDLVQITATDPYFAGQWGIVLRRYRQNRTKYQGGGPRTDVFVFSHARGELIIVPFRTEDIARWETVRGVVQHADGSLQPLEDGA